jgi:CopG family nickel-responsive transcriptional regulator
MSLPPELASEFDNSMKRAGFCDRSKAIHSFIYQNDGKGEDTTNGAGSITMLYNHAYIHDDAGNHAQHRYSDIISATAHTHLGDDIRLETIMVRGEIKKIKQLARSLSENRRIKSHKVRLF